MDKKGNKTEETFTIPQLVLIGDAIHNSKTAIILADNEENGGHNVTICVRGDNKKLISMIYHVLKDNKELEGIVSSALIMLKMESFHNDIEKLGGNKEL